MWKICNFETNIVIVGYLNMILQKLKILDNI